MNNEVKDIRQKERFFELLDFLTKMDDTGYLKEDVCSLIKEAYIFTHKEIET